MAQCSNPLSPENLPGPSGSLNQVEQEKEKPPQESSSGLYENGSGEFMENSQPYDIESEMAGSQMYEESDSDDGLDVVYGPSEPPPAGRMMQRSLYNQDCPSNNTSSICPRQQSSSRNWNHEGEHYSYCPTYSRVSRVHPQDYYQYNPPPTRRGFRRRFLMAEEWPEPPQPSHREMSTSSRFSASDPFDLGADLGYPTILRHPNRHRHRRQHIEPTITNRIPYHARPPVDIDIDYLDYDQGPPPTSMADTIRRPTQEPELDLSGMRNMRHDQQRQVLMRHASTSTPPMPSLRQNASTSTQQVEASEPMRKREPEPVAETVVPPKKQKVSNSTAQSTRVEVTDPHVPADVHNDHQMLIEDNAIIETVTEQIHRETEEENLRGIEPILHDTTESNVIPPAVSESSVAAATATTEASQPTITTAASIGVSVLAHTSTSNLSASASRQTPKTESRTVPSSDIEFVTSTLKPRSKPGSNQPSRKTSPNTSRASPVHVAAYSQEALRDLVCATLAPAAAANLIKSEKREKKSRETSRTSPDPIDDPQPGPSGLQSSSTIDLDRPGPSGTQTQPSDLQADDLQLDCLSSDSEGSSNEDVKVVKISRRTKLKKRPVEVDLTQDVTSDDDGDVVIEEVRSRPVSVAPTTATATASATEDNSDNKPEINIKTFASVPDNVTNIQSSSRGSTPAATVNLDHVYGPLTADAAYEEPEIPPPYMHRDHGYVRSHDPLSMSSSRPHMSAEEQPSMRGNRNDPAMDPLNMLGYDGFRPRRLRHPWRQEEPRRCEHHQRCSSSCSCNGRQRYQSSHSSGVHGSGHHSGHHYTNPPPAHRASMYPSTSSDYGRMGMQGTRPGSLLRAVQRMNPRHQRLYQLQQQASEQLRRWSVRAPPPPYPATSGANNTSDCNTEQPAAATSCADATNQQTAGPSQGSSSEQPAATATSNHPEAPQQRPMLSVPRVIMTSRPTLQIPLSAPSSVFPQHPIHPHASSSHTAPVVSSRGPPPPAHQPPPPRFPEEVQLPDSRRSRRCPRWHIPVMGDPHATYPHPEVDAVPLDMHTNPMYQPPPYHPNMILNAHHVGNGPMMMDPRDPFDPAHIPLGRENPGYPAPGMFNILFQPHRIGSMEV